MKEKNFKELKKRRFEVSQAMQNSTREHPSSLIYSVNLENKCVYHPEREALANCEHCGELVCAECRTIYRGDVLLGYPDEELCFQCKANKIKADRAFDLFMYGLILFGFIFDYIGLIVKSLLFGFP